MSFLGQRNELGNAENIGRPEQVIESRNSPQCWRPPFWLRSGLYHSDLNIVFINFSDLQGRTFPPKNVRFLLLRLCFKQLKSIKLYFIPNSCPKVNVIKVRSRYFMNKKILCSKYKIYQWYIICITICLLLLLLLVWGPTQ